MADIVIRKKVTLEFLDDCTEADYLVFRVIPVEEYKKIADKQPEDNIQAIDYIVKKLSDRFVEGRYKEQDVEKTDIGKFSAEVITECFAHISGQKMSPKV